MEFKRIQDKNTRLIIAYFVNNKPKTCEDYEKIESCQKNKGKNYNSSIVKTDKKSGNYIHLHHYN